MNLANHLRCFSGVHAEYSWSIIDSTASGEASFEISAKSFCSLLEKLISFEGHIQMTLIKPNVFNMKSVYESCSEQEDFFENSTEFTPINHIKYSLKVLASPYDRQNQYYFDTEEPVHCVAVQATVLKEHLDHSKKVNGWSFSSIKNDEFTTLVVRKGGNGGDDNDMVFKILSGKGQSFLSYKVDIDSSQGKGGCVHLTPKHLKYLIGVLSQLKSTVTLQFHADRLVIQNSGWSCSFKAISPNLDQEAREQQLRRYDHFVPIVQPTYLLETLIHLNITEADEKNNLKLLYSLQTPSQLSLKIQKESVEASDELTIEPPWFDIDTCIMVNVQAFNEILTFIQTSALIAYEKKNEIIHFKDLDNKYYFALQCKSGQ